MNSINNKTIQEKEFMNIAEKIEKIKINIEKPLGGILKYSAQNQIAESFFPEGIEKVTQKEIENATLFLNSYFNQFKRLSKEVKENTFLNDVQKKLFLGTLKSYCFRILLFKSAVYIEAEKGGYNLDKKEKDLYLKNIERIETVIYGPKISEKANEKDQIMSFLENLYHKNKDKLTEEEKLFFNNFLKEFSGRSEQSNKENENKNKLGRINQENLAKLFEKGLQLYDIPSKIVKFTEKIEQPKTENNILYIPSKDKETDKAISTNKINEIYKDFGYNDNSIKIKIKKCSAIEVNIPEKEINIPSSTNYYQVVRALELLSHEIRTHADTGINKENKFNIESDTYLELQEGVAMLNEKAVTTGIKEISAEPTIHHISTFIAENYDAKDTYELLKIYYKLNSKKNEETLAKNRTERVKRFHANDEKGANRKDVVYRRGMLDVLDYIQNLNENNIEDIKDLQEKIFNFYIGKLGKEEVKDAKELIEGFDITPKNIILPADIGKILLWMLEKNSTNDKEIKINNQTLGEKDIRFKASLPEQNLNYKEKKLLIEMRDFIKNTAEPNKE